MVISYIFIKKIEKSRGFLNILLDTEVLKLIEDRREVHTSLYMENMLCLEVRRVLYRILNKSYKCSYIYIFSVGYFKMFFIYNELLKVSHTFNSVYK